ncbi:MAG: nickel pincer cofactor biosynthesis protein LarC [Nitrososphaerales archaeon]
MKNKILYIDCSLAGISGDAFLSSLIDLGVDEERIKQAVDVIAQELKVKNYNFSLQDVLRKEFRAKYLELEVKEDKAYREGKELKKGLESILNNLKLSDRAKEYSRRALNQLVEVEANLHRESLEEVHLHEAGSMDTLVDIICSALALDALNLFEEALFVSSPVALGSGFLEFSHGKVSLPAPATLELLRGKGFLVHGGFVKEELTTPTGAAILGSLVNYCTDTFPKMKIDKIGYGAGKREFENIPNILRVVLGGNYNLFEEPLYILETNLDDVTGELLGYLIDKLMKEGAKDVNVIPMVGKKSRTVNMLRALCDSKDLERLTGIIFKESGTLGVRVIPCSRYLLRREILKFRVKVKGKDFEVNAKIARDKFGDVTGFKAEFDDVSKIAEATDLPLKDVYNIVNREIEKNLKRY